MGNVASIKMLISGCLIIGILTWPLVFVVVTFAMFLCVICAKKI